MKKSYIVYEKIVGVWPQLTLIIECMKSLDLMV